MRRASSAASEGLQCDTVASLDEFNPSDREIIENLTHGRYREDLEGYRYNLQHFLNNLHGKDRKAFLAYAQEKDLLTRSALYRSRTMFHWLLAQGANPNAYNIHPKSHAYKKAPVHVAAEEGDAYMIAALNHRGAKLDALSKTRQQDALFYAVRGAVRHHRLDALLYLLALPGCNIARPPFPFNTSGEPTLFYTYLCSPEKEEADVYFAHKYLTASQHIASMSKKNVRQHQKLKRREASQSAIAMLARSWMSNSLKTVEAVFASPAMQDDAAVVDAYNMVRDSMPDDKEEKIRYKYSILYLRLEMRYKAIMREFQGRAR